MELLLHPSVTAALDPERFAVGKTYLFVGRTGQGRRAAARELARQLNCLRSKEPCQNCRLFTKQAFPDLLELEPDGGSLKIEQVRELQKQLAFSPYQAASARFVLIHHAQTMTVEAQNAMLKLIEEPPAQTTIILITTDPEALLPTVRSRAQTVFFPPVSSDELTEWIGKRGLRPAKELASLATGAPGLAIRLASDPELLQTYQKADQDAARLIEAPLFDRLLLIKDVATRGEAVQLLSVRTVEQAKALARKGQSEPLEAAERLIRHLAAGVGPRAALEAFAVSL